MWNVGNVPKRDVFLFQWGRTTVGSRKRLWTALSPGRKGGAIATETANREEFSLLKSIGTNCHPGFGASVPLPPNETALVGLAGVRKPSLLPEALPLTLVVVLHGIIGRAAYIEVKPPVGVIGLSVVNTWAMQS